MRNQPRSVLMIGGMLVLVVSLACSLAAPQAGQPTLAPLPDKKTTPLPVGNSPSPTATSGVDSLTDSLLSTATAEYALLETMISAATGTPTQPAAGVNSGTSGGTGGSSGSGSGGGSAGGSGGGAGSGGSGSATPTSTPSPTPSETALPSAHPYIVKQIMTLGGEVISGVVCSTAQPFTVLSTTPLVTFTFLFTPQDAQHGNVTYSYSIPKAGESHQAAGTYTITPLGNDGTLQVSLSLLDHVVFKGFDGNIPNRYKFNLVPDASVTCPKP